MSKNLFWKQVLSASLTASRFIPHARKELSSLSAFNMGDEPQSYMSTHPNWKKPPIPYIPGAKINISAHEPPSLPPPRRGIRWADVEEWRDFSPLERCLKHPPPPGVNLSGSAVLEIQSLVQAHDDLRSQLVRVQVKPANDDEGSKIILSKLPPPDGQTQIIAKFYDPLYYDHDQTDGDVFNLINSTYPTEAGAYTKLQKIQGTVIPHYYGSFTCSFPVTAGEVKDKDDDKEDENDVVEGVRHVRLILIEYIPGRSMYSLDPHSLDVAQRQTILGAIIDAETAIFTENINLVDVAPRNTIVRFRQPPDSATTEESKRPTRSSTMSQAAGDGSQQQLRLDAVVLVDFDAADLGRQSPRLLQHWGEARYMPGVYISPLLRWAEYPGISAFNDWTEGWNWKEWIGERYDGDRPGITEAMKKVWRKGVA